MSADNEQGRKRFCYSGVVADEPSFKQARRLFEEEPPAKDDTAEFKWRGDPANTYSDWKVEIVHKIEDGAQKVDVYHVHKADLACGQRKSNYFHRLFQNGNKFHEGSVASSRIELEPLAAAAFPDLLDYCYDPSRALKVTTDTVLVLHYLGEYFEIQSLRYDAVQFIKQDLSVENAHTYLDHATWFHNDAMIETVAEFLAKNIFFVEIDLAISKLMKYPQLWLKMVGYVDKANREACEQCSYIVSQLNFDAETLKEITKSNNMPHIQSEAALNFLAQFKELNDGQEAIIADFASLQESLEDRCATSLSKGDIASYDPANQDNSMRILLKAASKPFLVDTLFMSWEELKDRNEKLAICQEEVKLLKTKSRDVGIRPP